MYEIEGKSKLLISKMELKHTNPSSDIVLASILNYVELFLF